MSFVRDAGASAEAEPQACHCGRLLRAQEDSEPPHTTGFEDEMRRLGAANLGQRLGTTIGAEIASGRKPPWVLTTHSVTRGPTKPNPYPFPGERESF